MSKNFKTIFQTDNEIVHALLNLDLGVNLASIGNKLYLIHSGTLPTNTTTTTTPTSFTTTTTTAAKNINLTSPNGGEVFQIGTTLPIRWTSSLGINEGIKVELYNGDNIYITIASTTSNNGSLDWEIPSDIAIGINYRIKLTRLTADTTPLESNYDYSSTPFSILLTIPTTTTTTTTTPSTNTPDTSNNRGIPILELLNDEYITTMIKDDISGTILFATSKGRILKCSEALVNAYMTGERKVFAEVADGFGKVSDTNWADFFYSLYHKIAEINEDKEMVKWHYAVDSSAIPSDRITATFLSPVLLVKEDWGFWKQLIWTEQKPENTNITICIRSANTLEDLQAKTWDNCFESDSNNVVETITEDLDDIKMDGKYIQFRIVMNTESTISQPVVVNLSITYSTKYAVYFFTTKFSLKNDTNLKKGLIVADVTEPQNTEVTFGIVDSNSVEWTDYQVVELNKFFSLDNFERFKVGIKFVSYGDNIPEVGEFSLMSGGEEVNLLNQ